MKYLRQAARIAVRLLGPVLLVYFLVTTDLVKLWETLLQTDPWLMGLALVLVVPFLFLKGWRWQLILDAWEIPIGIVDATALYTVGIFLGIMTPGQAGDAVKAWYLRQRGQSLAAGLASVVLDRLFDVGVMGVLAATGLYFFWDVLPGGRTLNVVTVVVMLLAVAAGLMVASIARLRARVLQLVPRSIRSRIDAAAVDRMHLDPRRLVLIVSVTILGLAFTFVRVYLLFLALDTPIDVGPFIALVATIALVGTASPGGVGTRDAVMVFVLTSLLDMPATDAQARAIAISTLLLGLTVQNVIIGYLVSFRYPLASIRSEPRQALESS
ncbi:MAG TPA: lysylphosphatidylglycerol synthase transmembrane domain-containing protein [Herpetosiphonaceae bacterium]|nr:lysylphosphatidylglycerol synthase transmembrane domain-containing protein [Herpetosiphonaceae bacterium]